MLFLQIKELFVTFCLSTSILWILSINFMKYKAFIDILSQLLMLFNDSPCKYWNLNSPKNV